MKSLIIIFFLIQCCCISTPDCRKSLKIINQNIESGDLVEALTRIDVLKKNCSGDVQLINTADSLAQIAERIRLDFSVNEDQVIRQLNERIGSFSTEEKILWENIGWLEWRLINGEKMYFNRVASNLVLLRNFHGSKRELIPENTPDTEMMQRLKNTADIYKSSENTSTPVVPVNLKITYTITVHPGVVPEGETIRCWLPWPKENHPRQQRVELLSTSSPEYLIAPDSVIHRSIYMEAMSEKGIPARFQISYKYQSNGQYFNMSRFKPMPYDKASSIYKKYTSEEPPQIHFSENIKRLADSIAGKDEDPAIIVSKIYSWFKANIPWTGALEYSVMPDIPEYVFKNRRGDCGMQTFLFISLLRYKGVPVRWQSGWMVPPVGKNLHDWCEIYFESIGWIPSDVSYDLQQSENSDIRQFFITGIDSYRLIVNDGIAGTFHPAKKYLRSEPYDFQRGELEWAGGNLYFDKWNYEMKIEYLK